MGEIFRRERADHPEPFTGETPLPSAARSWSSIITAILFARSRVADLDVLDVGSGEGYGAALLGQVARSVVLGFQRGDATVRSAARSFPRCNLHFLQGDALSLPMPAWTLWFHLRRSSTSIVKVTSAQAHSGCSPGGSFIVSTPDRGSPTAAPVIGLTYLRDDPS